MKSSNISLSKMAFWQLLSLIALKGISFFTTPITTRVLTPVDYDYLSIFNTWMSLFSILIGLQTYGIIANGIKKYSEKEIAGFFSSILSLSFVSFCIVLGLVSIFLKPISSFLEFSGPMVYLLLIYSFMNYCINFELTILNQYKKAQLKALITFVLALVSTAASLYLIFVFQENKYIGNIIGVAVPHIILGGIFLALIIARGKICFSKEYWMYCLVFCLPLIVHNISGLVMAQSDRVMLKKLSEPGQTGIYNLSYTLAMLIEMIWMACNQSWKPFYYDNKKEGRISQIRKDASGYTFTFTVITMGFLCCAPEVFKFLAPESYWNGLQIVPLVALAYYFNFLYAFPVNHEFYHEKTKTISLFTTICMIINIGLNFLLIPKWGGLGAAFTTMISHLVLLVLHDVSARFIVKDFEISPWVYIKGSIPVIIFCILYYYTMNLPFVRWLFAVVMGCLLLYRFYKRRSFF